MKEKLPSLNERICLYDSHKAIVSEKSYYILTMLQMSSNLPIRTSLAHTTVSFKSSSYERPCFKKEKAPQTPEDSRAITLKAFMLKKVLLIVAHQLSAHVQYKRRIKFRCLIMRDAENNTAVHFESRYCRYTAFGSLNSNCMSIIKGL